MYRISNNNWFITYHPQIGNILNKLLADDIITQIAEFNYLYVVICNLIATHK